MYAITQEELERIAKLNEAATAMLPALQMITDYAELHGKRNPLLDVYVAAARAAIAQAEAAGIKA